MIKYQFKSSINILHGNVLARVLYVNEAMFDSGLDQLLGHLGLVLGVIGDVDDWNLCNSGHGPKYKMSTKMSLRSVRMEVEGSDESDCIVAALS